MGDRAVAEATTFLPADLTEVDTTEQGTRKTSFTPDFCDEEEKITFTPSKALSPMRYNSTPSLPRPLTYLRTSAKNRDTDSEDLMSIFKMSMMQEQQRREEEAQRRE